MEKLTLRTSNIILIITSSLFVESCLCNREPNICDLTPELQENQLIENLLPTKMVFGGILLRTKGMKESEYDQFVIKFGLVDSNYHHCTDNQILWFPGIKRSTIEDNSNFQKFLSDKIKTVWEVRPSAFLDWLETSCDELDKCHEFVLSKKKNLCVILKQNNAKDFAKCGELSEGEFSCLLHMTYAQAPVDCQNNKKDSGS